MSIYWVKRTDDLTYDETIQMVIEAKNEQRARELFRRDLEVSGPPYDSDGRIERRDKIVATAEVTRLGATDKNLTERDTVLVHSITRS